MRRAIAISLLLVIGAMLLPGAAVSFAQRDPPSSHRLPLARGSQPICIALLSGD